MTKTSHKVANTVFSLDEGRFSGLKAIGKGSYGVVVSALDSNTKQRVAIKKIAPMAQHTVDAKHILREIRIMRYMGRHENIITLEDLIVDKENDELYIVMELLDSDLHRVIQSKQNLTENHFRYFMMQILCGLKYLHENRIIHRDLKPGNLLVTRECKLRITDFGLARERPVGNNETNPDDDIEEPMTEHVVTRWYRPPELMLVPDGMYTYAVDLWSVGCIFAEMLGRKPLFPGKNFVDQLTLIFDVIGSPLLSEVSHVRNAQAKKYLSSQSGKRAVLLERLFPKASQSALALLENLLLFAPERRLTVDEALATSFLDEAIDEDSPSMVFPESDRRFEFKFERDGSTKPCLKEMIYLEAQSLKHKDSPIDGRIILADKVIDRSHIARDRISRQDADQMNPEVVRAREWLSAAAQASSEYEDDYKHAPEHPTTVFQRSCHSRAARQLEDAAASERAMKMMQSPPSRKRRTLTATSINPRTTTGSTSSLLNGANFSGMPRVTRGSQKEGHPSSNGTIMSSSNRRPSSGPSTTRTSSTTTARKPLTVARSPKFSVLSRQREKSEGGGLDKLMAKRDERIPPNRKTSSTMGDKRA